mmetsp:Transcript_27330/g.81987  ORF Transcript_27330/g.81987 Transcript_27330/m.81987 type:complete len:284 (+) Transcript_27330:266-1117(+)
MEGGDEGLAVEGNFWGCLATACKCHEDVSRQCGKGSACDGFGSAAASTEEDRCWICIGEEWHAVDSVEAPHITEAARGRGAKEWCRPGKEGLEVAARSGREAMALGEGRAQSASTRRLNLAHIFDNCNDRNIDLVKERNALDDVCEGEARWGRDDYRCVNGKDLAERQLRVPSPRRAVDDQRVEVAPRHGSDKLLNNTCDACPPHVGGRRAEVAVAHDDEVPNTEGLQELTAGVCVALGREAHCRVSGRPQQRRQRWSVDVCVAEANVEANVAEHQCEACRSG